VRRGAQPDPIAGPRDPAIGAPPEEPREPGDQTPRMTVDFERIVRSIYAVDVWALYETARDDLALPVNAERASREDLRRHLALAEENARKAHLLWCNARVALEEWEAECEVATAHLRAEAQARLAQEKSEGRRPKQITDADVESEMAREHPDEFRRQRIGREKRKRMVEHLAFLAERWVSRRPTLEAMVASARSA